MCIPINEAKDVIESALNGTGNGSQQSAEKGRTSQGDLKGKPRMGVTVGTSTGRNGEFPKGVYISKVEEGSPAEQAGLLPGDIIVEVNGEVVTSVSEEVAIVSELKEGDEVAVKVFRPDEVRDAENGMISPEGEYIDLKVLLAMIDPVDQ